MTCAPELRPDALKYRILIFLDLRWPIDHSFVNNVLAEGFVSEALNPHLIVRKPGILFVEREVHHGAEVILVPGGAFRTLRAAAVNLIGLGYTTKVLFLGGPWTAVYVRNDPLFGVLCGIWRVVTGKPFAFQYSFPKSQLMKRVGSFFGRAKGTVAQELERLIFRMASVIYPISHAMVTDTPHLKTFAKKCKPMTLGVRDGQPIDLPDGVNEIPMLIYVGTHNRIREIDTLIRAIAKAAMRSPAFSVLFVGDSEPPGETERLKSVARDVLPRSVQCTFTGRVPMQKCLELIASADVGLAWMPPHPDLRSASPIKLMDYLSMARPVVATAGVIQQDSIVEKGECGILCDATETGFSEGIVALLQMDRLSRKRLGEKGRDFVRANYGYTMMSHAIRRDLVGL